MDSLVINIKDTDSINCSNCNHSLMMVYCREMPEKQKAVLEKNNAVLSRVQVGCPFCGDKSYDYEITGQFRYHPARDVKITGFEQKDDKVFFKTSR